MLDVRQFRELVIRPALKVIDLYSPAAEQLLLGTALQESRLQYLKQLGLGPALGPFQMEPFTHDDIWENFLAYKPELSKKIALLMVVSPDESDALPGNLYYAAAMCRVHYYRRPEALPAEDDIQAQAEYWKKHYNTPLGHGTVDQYMDNWERFAA